MYAKDSRSSLLLAVRPKCACTLAYRTVPLHIAAIHLVIAHFQEPTHAASLCVFLLLGCT